MRLSIITVIHAIAKLSRVDDTSATPAIQCALSGGGRLTKQKILVSAAQCCLSRVITVHSRTIFTGTMFPRSLSDPMTSKFLRSVLAIAVVSMISAFAQTSAAAPSGAANSPATGSPAASAPVATGPGSKIGTINIEQAVVGTNEGQRDFEA